jgi:hypothetical protein
MSSWLNILFRCVILVIFSADSFISLLLHPKCLSTRCQMALNNDHYNKGIPNTPPSLSEPVIFSKLFLFGNEFTPILSENDGSQSLEIDLDDRSSNKGQLRGNYQSQLIIITIEHLFSCN